MFPPAYWSLLDSDWLSAAAHPSTPAQKPEVKLLLLSWAEPNCCPAVKSSSGTLASFWAIPLQTVKGAKLEAACWGKKKKSHLLFSDTNNTNNFAQNLKACIKIHDFDHSFLSYVYKSYSSRMGLRCSTYSKFPWGYFNFCTQNFLDCKKSFAK